MTPQLLLIRHGSTASNSDPGSDRPDKVRGVSDLPITSEGKEEAKELGQRLRNIRIAKIYTSDLQRTTYTALQVQKAQPAPKPAMTPTKELRSWDLGNFVGKDYKKVMPELERYQLKAPSVKVPGGESWNNFLGPWLGFLRTKMEEAKKAKGAIALVTHTWNLRSLDGWLRAGMNGNEVDPESLKSETPASPGEAVLYEFKSGKWVEDEDFLRDDERPDVDEG